MLAPNDTIRFRGGWSPARIELLTDLWIKGFSGSLIGAELGITRSAVIAKVRRLKLAERPTRRAIINGVPIDVPPDYFPPGHGHKGHRNGYGTLRRRQPQIKFRRRITDQSTYLSGRWLCGPPKQGKSFMELGFGECRYPMGEPPNYEPFCGLPVISETSWCAQHTAVVFNRTATRASMRRCYAVAA